MVDGGSTAVAAVGTVVVDGGGNTAAGCGSCVEGAVAVGVVGVADAAVEAVVEAVAVAVDGAAV